MKKRIFLIISALALLVSGCVVYSFYPLYTEEDLFANDLLTGNWFENDNEGDSFDENEDSWTFEHPELHQDSEELDSTSYILTLQGTEDGEAYTSVFLVHVIKLGGNFFLDFYLEEYPDNGKMRLSTFHVIPVHTFAKLIVGKDQLTIRWFDPDWLEKLIRENKIRIHHEDNDDMILLTAKPHELQKFVTKYVNSEEAFKDGLDVTLLRKK